jgi:HD-GYP domain-containing protein (c-di-GMP phosphodiesterase class II)
MPLEKAVEILKQEANNGKLDKLAVNHLIEVVSGSPTMVAT